MCVLFLICTFAIVLIVKNEKQVMLKQKLQLKLSQKLSPQQIQLMKLVQLNTLAFEERVNQELEENPALEANLDDNYSQEREDDDFSRDQSQDQDEQEYDPFEQDENIYDYYSDDQKQDYQLEDKYDRDDNITERFYQAELSFNQSLENQLNTFALEEQDMEIALFLIGNIDEDGYIRRDLKKIADDLAFSHNIFVDEKKIESVLKNVIFELDPTGVGARDLQECLVLQLKKKKKNQTVLLAIDILTNSFDMFSKKHYAKLCRKYGIGEDDLQKVVDEVSKLNPKPGEGNREGRLTELITPDFTITIENGELKLSLNSFNSPRLHISKNYLALCEKYKNSPNKEAQKEAVAFIKQKIDSANWFINAIKQRQNTLRVTMEAIMQAQKEYFLTGDEQNLKPLVLRDIAEKVGMDISTISRVANSKYVDTPYGIRLIKDFFSEALKNDMGEDVSTHEIKDILKEMIVQEDKTTPLPDEELTKKLQEKGYNVARRTIAKYREQLNIPVARLRKQISND